MSFYVTDFNLIISPTAKTYLLNFSKKHLNHENHFKRPFVKIIFSRIEQKSGKIPQRAMLKKRKNSQAFHTHSRPLTRLASGMSDGLKVLGGGGSSDVVIAPPPTLVEKGLN